MSSSGSRRMGIARLLTCHAALFKARNRTKPVTA
jgi:hypothetical protein